jgi:hypothetical protein
MVAHDFGGNVSMILTLHHYGACRRTWQRHDNRPGGRLNELHSEHCVTLRRAPDTTCHIAPVSGDSGTAIAMISAQQAEQRPGS